MQEQRCSRRQEQAQESRQRLMDAALALFASHGYTETSVHALCTGLGVADSLLYHYFPGGKKELIRAIVSENLMEVMGELRPIKETVCDLPLEETIESLYREIRRAVLSHGDLFRLLLQQKEIRNIALNERAFLMISAQEQWFMQLLRSRAEKGEIQPMDFEAAAETLDSLMIHHLSTELLGLPGSPLGREANRKKLIAHQVSLWKRKTAIEE